jgi:hypothetical protein
MLSWLFVAHAFLASQQQDNANDCSTLLLDY